MKPETLNTEQQPQLEETPEADLSEPHPQSKGIDQLPLVDRLFVDESISEEAAQKIASHLVQDESIFALFQLNSPYEFNNSQGKVEKVPIWTIVTQTRLFLLAVSSEGVTYCDTFDQDTIVEYHDGLARDEVKIADKTISTGIWEGKRKLFKEAVNLFSLPEYEKYLYIADVYLKKEEYAQAIPFLQKSLDLVPTIKAYLLLVHSLSRSGTTDKVIEVFQQAYQLAEPASILQELQILFPENLVMFLYHAVACEKNYLWDACIEVYRMLLQKTPDFDLYFLKLGEMYNYKKKYQTAIEYYQKFIKLRTESEKSEHGDFINWDLSDTKCFEADPDLTRAVFDLGVIYETELTDLERAFSLYLSLLREAPFYTNTYKHFWHVYQQLINDQEPHSQIHSIHINGFLQVYRLLDPAEYSSVISSPISSQEEGLLSPDHKLRERDHNAAVHPGEQEYLRQIQNWLTSLVISETDEQGIEQYCEQVEESNYPQLFRTIERVARFLDIGLPKCFISRGKIGVSVKNTEHPFIFIGSEHLHEDNERYFSETELLFTIAAQAEHIKSGHLLITGTELWKNLGTASFDGFLTALQYLPAGSFIGKVTHKFATEGLKKVYKMTKYSSIQKILHFVEKKVSDRGPEETSDTEDDKTSAQKNDRVKSQKQSEPDSILKEQIVDFARHAVYTADRVGLLACDDVGSACSAIFKLAGSTSDDLETIQHEGLLPVLEKKDKRGNFMYFEYAKRFNELIKFALSEDYRRIHENLIVLSEDQLEEKHEFPRYTTEHQDLIDKLQLLNQTKQKELLTDEEFFMKQKTLLKGSGFFLPEDEILVDKFQQACRDGILTYEELQIKIFQLLETRIKEGIG